MNTANTVEISGGRTINLKSPECHYVGAGGQATIYRIGKEALKIYHDREKMIPEAKLQELMRLKSRQVIRPTGIIKNARNKEVIGYTMKYIEEGTPLCKLFTKSFRTEHQINDRQIRQLIASLQNTIEEIHDQQILVVDLNELNVLVTTKTMECFIIDTDSFQTSQFPATAIMESVRDRHGPKGKVNEGTDWFSFAILITQLYTGMHPYRGRHPKYQTHELNRRMLDNISIFNRNVRLPPVANRPENIPEPHRNWLERVLEQGERCRPPKINPEAEPPKTASPICIEKSNRLTTKELIKLPERIQWVTEEFGIHYYVTKHNIFRETECIWSSPKSAKRWLIKADGGKHVVAEQKSWTIHFSTLNNTELNTVVTKHAFMRNGNLYTQQRQRLTEHRFRQFNNNIFPEDRHIDNIAEHTSQFFEGCVLQDLLNKTWITIPYTTGKTTTFPVPELHGHRILEAQSQEQTCVVLSEKNGQYQRHNLFLQPNWREYTIQTEGLTEFEALNFCGTTNGINLLATQTELKIYTKTRSEKIIDSPVTPGMKLFCLGNKVGYLNGKSAWELRTK